MDTQKKACIVCEKTAEEIPLLTLVYKDQQYFICPQHFPILIHHPEKLTGILPGAENLNPENH